MKSQTINYNAITQNRMNITTPDPTTPECTFLDPLQNVHTIRSRRLILKAADAARPKNGVRLLSGKQRQQVGGMERAIVIGAGRCREIPLAGLLERCDRLILTDIDADRLKYGMEETPLTAQQRQRIDTQVGDVLGLASPFHEAINECFSQDWWSGPAQQFLIERMASIAKNLQPAPRPQRGRFDLVIASCVLSQLHLGAFQRAFGLFARRGNDRRRLQEAPQWVEAARGLAGRMQRKFIKMLEQWIRPRGRIYLAATPRVSRIELCPGQQKWKAHPPAPMTDHTALADFIDESRFVIETRSTWLWADPPPCPEKPGNLFEVEAMILAPRE